MQFDWVTWGVWALGLIILIVWIYVPIVEFRQLLKDRKVKSDTKARSAGGE